MKIINKIRVERFRSIKHAELEGLEDFSALAGMNNSGKSNILRALNLFFNGYIDESLGFDINRDYYRIERNSKKKKVIRVTVYFSLPDKFVFRNSLDDLEKFIGREFSITKEWGFQGGDTVIYFNDSPSALNQEDIIKIENFLSLINYRYIPNRVIPTDIINKEQDAMRDVLVRRLSKHQKAAEELLDGIRSAASTITSDMSSLIVGMFPGVSEVRLGTAKDLADIAFNLGYVLQEGKLETDQDEQGSGAQSLLMFQTLHMIDRDFFQKFGWRQAAIWAVEEPESSLHTKLEAEVAYFLANISKEKRGRLQIISTTHSDLMVQYADSGYFIEKTTALGTISDKKPVKELLDMLAKFGVSRWVNPILHYPHAPLILVEGKIDRDVILDVMRLLKMKLVCRVECLADLKGDETQGGVDRLLKFLKEHADAISMRSPLSPVLVILDWDAEGKIKEFEKIVSDKSKYKVMSWNKNDGNPKLDKSFRGIEKFFSDRIVDIASTNAGGVVAERRNGTKQVGSDDYSTFKNEAYKIIQRGMIDEDIEFMKNFVESAYSQCVNVE